MNNDAIQSFLTEYDRLVTERDALRNEVNELRELKWKNAELVRENEKARQKVDAAQAEIERHRREADYWKRATRYEQSAKSRQATGKNVRHLPIFNSVKRARVKAYDKYPNRERIFLSLWREENKRICGTNLGYGVLELILSNDSSLCAAPLSQRDATVAATVIQWLGTNCGQCFLHSVDKAIRNQKRAGEKL